MPDLDDERFDELGNEDPDGKWHWCGCGDLILLDVDQCENCRVLDELTWRACRTRSPQGAAICVLHAGHPGPHFGNGYDEVHNRAVPVWWNR